MLRWMWSEESKKKTEEKNLVSLKLNNWTSLWDTSLLQVYMWLKNKNE